MENLFSNIEQIIRTNPIAAFPAVFAAGVLTTFTPCVYPVIPLTLGVIGARSAGSRRRGLLLSLVYVFGLAVTYAALGAIASLSGKMFGQISSHPMTYFVVANVCLLFGLSMLDVFSFPQIVLSQTGGRPRASGYFGIFVMGLFSGLVIGPCTAPVLGAILVYVGSKQNLIYGTSLLFVYGYGVGALLIILGTFTGLLASLPRSGPWLSRTKKIFGWILIMTAEYLLIKSGGLF